MYLLQNADRNNIVNQKIFEKKGEICTISLYVYVINISVYEARFYICIFFWISTHAFLILGTYSFIKLIIHFWCFDGYLIELIVGCNFLLASCLITWLIWLSVVYVFSLWNMFINKEKGLHCYNQNKKINRASAKSSLWVPYTIIHIVDIQYWLLLNRWT